MPPCRPRVLRSTQLPGSGPTLTRSRSNSSVVSSETAQSTKTESLEEELRGPQNRIPMSATNPAINIHVPALVDCVAKAGEARESISTRPSTRLGNVSKMTQPYRHHIRRIASCTPLRRKRSAARGLKLACSNARPIGLCECVQFLLSHYIHNVCCFVCSNVFNYSSSLLSASVDYQSPLVGGEPRA